MPFQLRRESALPSLGVTYQEFHDESGAKHIHLKADSDENCFMVSFPTVPRADDGRAHILEHLSLCGSAKYPTRDPFFAMTRRSLATFMNAMTAADATMYPFASQGRKDFFNLLDVYLDAAFFPNLDRIDFLQEGWRLNLDENDKLSYNGVVFNEMKEPMANPGRAVWRGIQNALKPGTTYAFESGGDPLAIPELSHEELKGFHATHYHPSRATFWSYGDLDPHDIQARIESEVISKIKTRLPRVEPDSAIAPLRALSIDTPVPATGGKGEHGFSVSWLIGQIGRDHDRLNDWQIFFQAISADSASPLIAALEGAGFGRPGLIGVDNSHRQATAHIGMDGLEADEVPKARALLFSTLEQIARDGIPESRLRSVLRNFELSSLEIQGGRTPHGLKSLMGMMAVELNGGDPLRELDTLADLAKSAVDISDPDFIKSMARELLASEARVEARSVPDADLLPSRERREAEGLLAIHGALTDSEKAQIRKDSEELLARQRAKPDFSSLPKISPGDIERDPSPQAPLEFLVPASGPSTAFSKAATNGVGYFGVVIDASRVDPEDWAWLALGKSLAMELGFGDLDYQQADLRRSERGSGFQADLEVGHAERGAEGDLSLRLRYSAKALEREASSMAQALCETLRAPRFDERERMAFLIQSTHQEATQSIPQAGAALAAIASGAALGGTAAFAAATGGISQLAFLGQLDALSRSDEGLAQIQERLESVFAKLADAPTLATYYGSPEASELAFAQAASLLASRPPIARLGAQERPIFLPPGDFGQPVALHGPGQLNYCHARWAGPKPGHPDAGPAMVLGAYLSNTFLHRAVREEGGAYGGSASYGAGAISMSSYRDPRLAATYADFDAAIQAAASGKIEPDDLGEAIVSIMQSLDKPGTPKEKASIALSRALGGIDMEHRKALRRAILECSEQDLRRVAATYLVGQPRSTAAYVCPKSEAEADAAGMLRHDVLPKPPKRPRP